MKNQLQQSLQNGLNYLKSQQLPSGKFQGYSASSLDISDPVPTDTLFFTALVSDCLQNIPSARAMRVKAGGYLLAQRSEQWTWNYWGRASEARPYPDDWDDTACAVAALVGCDPECMGPEDQARLITQLIHSEQAVGGPYVTWLVPEAAQQWRDVDVVVNANIGYMLYRFGLSSSALEGYMTDCIVRGELQSKYYCSSISVMYFIARWYKGTAQDTLLKKLSYVLREEELSALELAMVISSCIRLGGRKIVTVELIERLLRQQCSDGSWPAHGLYYEPPENGSWHYAGSDELSTAFVLEALNLWLHILSPSTTEVVRRDVLHIAEIVTRAGNWSIYASVKGHLDQGSELGWKAYAIYDDLLDGDANLAQLGEANIAMRQSYDHFMRAMPGNDDFMRFVSEAFDRVDQANAWELREARNPNKLPDYGDYRQLAWRSWGHVIAPTGVLIATGYKIDGSETTLLHQFFHHYIIARQLCDDAHDWLIDLQAKRVTAVVALLLADFPDVDLQEQQLYFWQHTIDQVNALIRDHLAQARTVLAKCSFFEDKTTFEAWLNKVEQTCMQAEQGRHQAQQFIATFTAQNLVH